MEVRATLTTTLALAALVLAACASSGPAEPVRLDYSPEHRGSVKHVRGVLRANPEVGRPGIRMRTHYYTIGDYRVFTAGERLPKLGSRINQRVELIGWVQEVNLEGETFLEIRPMSVRDLH